MPDINSLCQTGQRTAIKNFKSRRSYFYQQLRLHGKVLVAIITLMELLFDF
jgi:hypothetical protein